MGYAKTRIQSGSPSPSSGIQWMIADMATELDAARLLTLRRLSEGPEETLREESGHGQLFASEAANRIASKRFRYTAGMGM